MTITEIIAIALIICAVIGAYFKINQIEDRIDEIKRKLEEDK